MICLLLMVTMVFVESSEGGEQKGRHADTSLKEEEMNAKTKAWLLMVESGKVDQDELRRITPKSIFIAPLLTNGAGKCKEGYRHDHLGQCVKVIKIDPKVQLELLLQRLNKLYAEKAEEKEPFQASSGPLQFSLPISSPEENASQPNATAEDDSKDNSPLPEFIPVPLPFVRLNQTNQTKEIESSGAEPLTETEPTFEGSGAESGEGPLEETTTEAPVSLLPDDYQDAETTTATDDPTTADTTTPEEDNSTESYPNAVNATADEPEVKHPDRIVFPTEEVFRGPIVAAAQSSRIRFPDEPASHQPPPEPDRFQAHSSAIPQEQFWWLPKNWQIDGSQHKSALVKVWSRLPLIHDITYSQGTADGFKPAFPPSERPYLDARHHQPPARSVKHLNRFHDIAQTPRRSFRIHR